jgi:hypothetical protein
MLNVVMLSIILPNVIMLSVVAAPFCPVRRLSVEKRLANLSFRRLNVWPTRPLFQLFFGQMVFEQKTCLSFVQCFDNSLTTVIKLCFNTKPSLKFLRTNTLAYYENL